MQEKTLGSDILGLSSSLGRKFCSRNSGKLTSYLNIHYLLTPLLGLLCTALTRVLLISFGSVHLSPEIREGHIIYIRQSARNLRGTR